MDTLIRAIYEKGHLRLLDPVNLTEGQEINVVILTERERAVAALGDLVAPPPHVSDVEIDEETLLKEIDAAYRGNPPVSDAIIEDRREGP